MPMSAWKLFPPAPEDCQECARHHEPDQPHDPQSLYWRTKRNIEGRSAPTWKEAMEHCSPEMKAAWVEALAEKGMTV